MTKLKEKTRLLMATATTAKTAVLAVTAALALTACSSADEDAPMPSPTGMTTLQLNAGYTVDASVKSRADDDGNSGDASTNDDSQYAMFSFQKDPYHLGLWICKTPDDENSNTYEPIMDGMKNLRADLDIVALSEDGTTGESWSYVFNDNEKSEHNILGIPKKSAVTIYPFSPYSDGVIDLTQIPFTSGAQNTMWGKTVKLTESDTKGDQCPVTLKFNQLMTCIQVKIKCKYDGNVSLNKMKLRDVNATTPFYLKGTMNLLLQGNGEMLTLDENSKADSIVIVPENSSLNADLWSVFNIYFPQVSGYTNNQYELSFVFNNTDAKNTFLIPNTITQTSDDGTTKSVTINGFKTGKRYIYELTLDNVVRFTPVKVAPIWTDKDVDMEL